MALLLKCKQCDRDLFSSGFRGLCPECLFRNTTEPLADLEESPKESSGEAIRSGAKIGANGRFLLLEKIGEGGMGEVWLADDQQLSGPGHPHLVALKFISQSIRGDRQALSSLRGEVLRTQSLSHQNIVRIHDMHTAEDGTPFIKMEYIEGNSLSHALATAHGGVLDWVTVVKLAHQLASALQYAHETAGIIHRDIKPSNLLLAKGSVLKLTDFGIAGVLHGQRDENAAHNQELCTLWYSSPRQAAGETPTTADDIYSVGATLYELLSGAVPFEAPTSDELLLKIQATPADPIPKKLKERGVENRVPRKLLSLVHRCLDKDPVNRPTARELSKALPPVDATSIGALRELDETAFIPKEEQKKSRLVPILAALVVLAAGAGYLYSPMGAPALTRITKWLRELGTDGQAVRPPPPEANSTPNSARVAVVVPPEETVDIDKQKAAVFETGSLRFLINNPQGGSQFSCEITAPGRPSLRHAVAGSGTVITNLQPGPYLVTMIGSSKTRKTDWRQSKEVVVGADSTAQLAFTFHDYEELKIERTPASSVVSWIDLDNNPLSSHRPGTLTNLQVSAKSRFRSGRYTFTASEPGYKDWTLTTNFNSTSMDAVIANVVLEMERPLNPPNLAERWTNSLGMVFKNSLRTSPANYPFYVCTTETSIGQYARFVRETGHQAAGGAFSLTAKGYQQTGAAWDNPGWTVSPDYPVVCVNQEDAMAFCKWLTELERKNSNLATNQEYRLPTINEWQNLAGGKKYPWGDGDKIVGNYSGEEVTRFEPVAWPKEWPTLGPREDDIFPRTTPPGPGFLVNGLYHMGGNAAEWCQESALCGGSWFDGETMDMKHLETSNVLPADPKRRDDRFGFRVVVSEK